MQKKGIDLLISQDPANMNYLTGYDAWSFYYAQCVLVHINEDEPICFLRAQDVGGAYIKTYLQHVKPLSIAAGNYVIIFIPALLVLILTDFFNVENLDQSEFVSSIGFVVVLSFFGTALAKVLFNKLVQMSTPVFASSVTYIMPIVALIWGLLDNETFSWTQGLGSLIILFGVFLANRKQKKIRSN